MLAFDAASRLALLDSFAGSDLTPVAEAFAAWNAVRNRIAELERDEQDRLRLLDLWNFQRKEIAGANLHAEEDIKLEAEKRVLANSERILTSAMGAYDALYEGNVSASALIRSAAKQLEELSRFDEKFREPLAQLDSARITVEDIGQSLRDYAEDVEASPERLAEVEDRLAAIDRLKRKYGPTLGDVIALGEELERKLNEMENKDEVLRKLRIELAKAAERYLEAARSAVAASLRSCPQAGEAGRERGQRVGDEGAFQGRGQRSGRGRELDLRRFRRGAVPDLGESGRAAGAGGGDCIGRRTVARDVGTEDDHRRGECRSERGRTVPKAESGQRTLVFDEIDSGIGGRAAEAVGKKLKQLAATKQVLCVTHLPQIASFADQHYLIEKKESGGRTRTSRPATRLRRTHAGTGAHDQRRKTDRHLARARRADAEDQPVRAS